MVAVISWWVLSEKQTPVSQMCINKEKNNDEGKTHFGTWHPQK